MSQRAVFVRVDGNLHSEVLTHVPDHDEMVQICKDCGYEATDARFDNDYLLVEYEWVDIGDGESGIDTFFSDEELCYIYDGYGWEDKLLSLGYDVNIIETGNDDVEFEELEDE